MKTNNIIIDQQYIENKIFDMKHSGFKVAISNKLKFVRTVNNTIIVINLFSDINLYKLEIIQTTKNIGFLYHTALYPFDHTFSAKSIMETVRIANKNLTNNLI